MKLTKCFWNWRMHHRTLVALIVQFKFLSDHQRSLAGFILKVRKILITYHQHMADTRAILMWWLITNSCELYIRNIIVLGTVAVVSITKMYNMVINIILCPFILTGTYRITHVSLRSHVLVRYKISLSCLYDCLPWPWGISLINMYVRGMWCDIYIYPVCCTWYKPFLVLVALFVVIYTI